MDRRETPECTLLADRFGSLALLEIRRLLISLSQAIESVRRYATKSVTHIHYDVRPVDCGHIPSRRALPRFDRYAVTLLGDLHYVKFSVRELNPRSLEVDCKSALHHASCELQKYILTESSVFELRYFKILSHIALLQNRPDHALSELMVTAGRRRWTDARPDDTLDTHLSHLSVSRDVTQCTVLVPTRAVVPSTEQKCSLPRHFITYTSTQRHSPSLTISTVYVCN